MFPLLAGKGEQRGQKKTKYSFFKLKKIFLLDKRPLSEVKFILLHKYQCIVSYQEDFINYFVTIDTSDDFSGRNIVSFNR